MIIPLKAWSERRIQVWRDNVQVDPVTEDPDELVALDLHIGNVRFAPGSDPGRRLRDGSAVYIDPGQAMRIQTAERLIVGPEAFGQVCSRAHLTTMGVVVANIKVDPLFQGALAVTIYNVSQTRVRLDRNEAFCSVFFQDLEEPVEGPTRTPPPPIPKPPFSARDTLGANRRAILTGLITLAVSVLGSIIATQIDGPNNTGDRSIHGATTTIVPTSVNTTGTAQGGGQ